MFVASLLSLCLHVGCNFFYKPGTLGAQPIMNIIDKITGSIDSFQRKYHFTGFTYGVIKKYGEDKSGYQAALLTYYGFLALFPLLLVLTTLAGIIADGQPHLKTTIITGMTHYFPVLGSQLSDHISTLHKSGIALVVGIIFTLYGARGVADVFRRGVLHIWHEPEDKSEAFLKKIAKNLSIVIVGGLGLLAASILAGVASAAGHGILFRALSIAVNMIVLFLLFSFLINASLPRHVTLKETRPGALTAAVGLVVLQWLGTYLLTRELKSLDAIYSTFAISLGLLFWIYLQAQLLYYAVTVAAVSSKHLWPRSLTGKNPTNVDNNLTAMQKAH